MTSRLLNKPEGAPLQACLTCESYPQNIRLPSIINDEQNIGLDDYYEPLYTAEPPSGHLQSDDLWAVNPNPSIDDDTSNSDDVREVGGRLKGGEAAGICNIIEKMLKAVG